MKQISLYFFFLFLVLLLSSSGCEKEVSVTPEFSLPPMGSLYINSIPDSALIYINEKNTGYLTPDTIRFLEPGSYLVTLKKEYFNDVEKTIEIIADTMVQYILDYHTVNGINGEVSILSTPNGAVVYVDGQSTGKITPVTIFGLFPGSHNIKLTYPGYWDDSSDVIIKSSFTSYLDITMSDSLTWVNFNEDNSGLPSMFLNFIDIDPAGRKWIATAGEGLVRFDDKEWIVYNTSNSPLPDDYVKHITHDNDNNIWIGTLGGLVKFDGVNWTIYNTLNSGLPADDINCISVEQEGTVWIGSNGAGLIKFDGNEWIVYNSSNSPLTSNFVKTIYIDETGIKFIGTAGGGIVKFTGATWLIYGSFPPGISNNVSFITKDKIGKYWAALIGGISFVGGSAYLENSVWQVNPALPSSNVFSIAVDNNNYIWFGNELTGVSKYANGTWTDLNTTNSKLPNDKIFSIAVDREGNKWFATFGGGLSKYKGN